MKPELMILNRLKHQMNRNQKPVRPELFHNIILNRPFVRTVNGLNRTKTLNLVNMIKRRRILNSGFQISNSIF